MMKHKFSYLVLSIRLVDMTHVQPSFPLKVHRLIKKLYILQSGLKNNVNCILFQGDSTKLSMLWKLLAMLELA